MTFYLNLFTGTTWEEFQKAGAKVTGFRDNSWKRAEKIKKGMSEAFIRMYTKTGLT